MSRLDEVCEDLIWTVLEWAWDNIHVIAVLWILVLCAFSSALCTLPFIILPK